jgi:hypothetical protein
VLHQLLFRERVRSRLRSPTTMKGSTLSTPALPQNSQVGVDVGATFTASISLTQLNIELLNLPDSRAMLKKVIVVFVLFLCIPTFDMQHSAGIVALSALGCFGNQLVTNCS